MAGRAFIVGGVPSLRRKADIYSHDGPDRVIIAASHAGAPHRPVWYHNLCAKADVTFAGAPMRATGPVELERLWPLADRVFPAHAVSRRSRAVKCHLSPGGRAD